MFFRFKLIYNNNLKHNTIKLSSSYHENVLETISFRVYR